MKNLRMVLTLAMALTLSAPYMVQAQPQHEQRDPIETYKEAGATPEQQTKIREMANEFESMARGKAKEAEGLMHKMHDLSLEPLPDEKQVLSTQNELNNLQAEISTARLKLMIKIRHLLTPEQRDKLVQILKSHSSGGQGK